MENNNTFIKTIDSSKVYHGKKEYIGSTSVKLYLKSPAHYLYDKNNPKEVTEDMQMGSAYHTFNLEESKFNDEVYVLDEANRPFPDKDYKTKENKNWKLDAYEDNKDKIIINMYQFDEMKRMRDVLHLPQNEFALHLLRGSEREVSYYGELNGVKVKIRPDSYQKGQYIADLKTCQDSSTDYFKKHSFDMGYHISAAMYYDVICAYNGSTNDAEGFFFVAQEKKPPYNVNVFVASEQFMAQGRHIYENLLRLHKHCLETNEWKGYEVFSTIQNNVQILDLPSWAMKELIINI